jgi:hypothetical protein
LAWRHAAIVLFGQTWRATAFGFFLPVILSHHPALIVAKIATDVDFDRLALLLTVFFLTMFVLAFASPLWLGRLGCHAQEGTCQPQRDCARRQVERGNTMFHDYSLWFY